MSRMGSILLPCPICVDIFSVWITHGIPSSPLASPRNQQIRVLIESNSSSSNCALSLLAASTGFTGVIPEWVFPQIYVLAPPIICEQLLMECRARRRLNLISSHVNPPVQNSKPNCVSSSFCNAQNYKNDCVFCKIIRGEAPAFKVYEDDACLCILDTYPLSLGHLLIIPKCHYSSLDVTPPSIIGAMCSKVPLISNAVLKATGYDSFNLLVNNGEAAGQVVYHTHIHIIPRKAQDCLWTSESLRRHPLKIDQDASKLADCISKNLSSADKSKVEVSRLERPNGKLELT